MSSFVPGHYMLGGMNFGRLMAPVIDVQTDSCLHFRYHIRGERAGRLSVVSYTVDSVDVPIETLENIVDPPTTLFTVRINHYLDVPWALWGLMSPTTPLFVQQLV